MTADCGEVWKLGCRGLEVADLRIRFAWDWMISILTNLTQFSWKAFPLSLPENTKFFSYFCGIWLCCQRMKQGKNVFRIIEGHKVRTSSLRIISQCSFQKWLSRKNELHSVLDLGGVWRAGDTVPRKKYGMHWAIPRPAVCFSFRLSSGPAPGTHTEAWKEAEGGGFLSSIYRILVSWVHCWETAMDRGVPAVLAVTGGIVPLVLMLLSAVWCGSPGGHQQRQFPSSGAAEAAFQGSITTGMGISRHRKRHYSELEPKMWRMEKSHRGIRYKD